MPPQRPIHLCEVINRVWKYHCKGQDAFRTLVDRRAAGLAASRDEEPINDAQRALLRDVAEGRLAIADLRERDGDAHFAMRRCSGVARAQLLGDDGIEPQGEIVWEIVRQWVFDRVRIPVTNNQHVGRIRGAREPTCPQQRRRSVRRNEQARRRGSGRRV